MLGLHLPADIKKLNSKMFGIHITNICNLHCGGCDQLCGYFDKNKHFFISLDELKDNIECFYAYKDENWSKPDFPEEEKVVLLYGGEPTLHPEYDQIIEVLHTHHAIPFCIYTNGRKFVKEHLMHIDLELSRDEISYEVYKTKTLPKTGYERFSYLFRRYHAHDRNIAYRIDYKLDTARGEFAPVLCAPIDINRQTLDGSVKLQMWEQAQKYCYKWTKCENSIYNNKAYGCNVAASMDMMFNNGANGIAVKKGQNPFNIASDQLATQMCQFCYRCGYNCNGGLQGFKSDTEKVQHIHKGSLITKTNYVEMDSTSPQFPRLQIIEPVDKKVPSELLR